MSEKNPLNVHLDVSVEGGDPQSLDFTIEQPEGVNITSAQKALEDAEAARAAGTDIDSEEVNYQIKTLQELQNSGITDPEIQTTLARLIQARGE